MAAVMTPRSKTPILTANFHPREGDRGRPFIRIGEAGRSGSPTHRRQGSDKEGTR